MGGTSQTAGHGLELRLKTTEVDKCGHESRNLNVGRDDKLSNELLKSRKGAIFGSDSAGLRAPGRSWDVVTSIGRSGRHES